MAFRLTTHSEYSFLKLADDQAHTHAQSNSPILLCQTDPGDAEDRSLSDRSLNFWAAFGSASVTFYNHMLLDELTEAI
jgi:hypothetical protein